MLYIAVLVTLLVVMAGVIAYAGDVLGALIGRRRLSLFGWRPRRTGQIVGVMGGILIMLVTLGTLMIAFRGATGVLVSAQQTAVELDRLRSEQRELERNVRMLETEVELRIDELEEARRTSDAAIAERDAAIRLRADLLAEQQTLEEELGRLQTEIASLNASLDEAEATLTATQGELALVNDELEEAKLGREEAQADLSRAIRQATEARLDARRFRDEADTLREQVAAAQRELAASNRELEELQGSLASVRDELLSSQAERDRAVGEAQVLLETKAQLDQQVRTLQSDVQALEATGAQLQVANRELEENQVRLVSDNDRLQELNSALGEQNEELVRSIRVLGAEVVELQGTVEDLRERLDDQARALAAAQGEVERVQRGELSFRAGDMIHSGIIRAADPVGIQEELLTLISQASRETSRREMGEVVLSSMQFTSLMDALYETPGEDIVILYSPVNQLRNAQVIVEIEAYENSRLLAAGQLVTSRSFHLGSADAPLASRDIMAELVRLHADSSSRLQRLGLFEGERPRRAPESLSDEAFVSQLSRISGPVTVGLVTAEEVLRSGPAYLELVILH